MDPKTRLDENEKRNIPVPLQKLLAYDVELTKRFVSFSLNFVPIRSLKTHCKFLEVSYCKYLLLFDNTTCVMHEYAMGVHDNDSYIRGRNVVVENLS